MNESVMGIFGSAGPGLTLEAAIIYSLFILLFLLLALLFFGWIWMIIDCVKRNRFRSGDRVVWILLLVLTGIIGMILYYFMVMRKD